MTPTPVRETPQHPARFAFPPIRGFRFDADRRNVTPILHTPVTPLVDEGAEGDQDSDEGSIEPGENDEEIDEDEGSEEGEEGADEDQEEGDIEEGRLHHNPSHNSFPTT